MDPIVSAPKRSFDGINPIVPIAEYRTTKALPNKAVEDDGDKRICFGLRALSREMLASRILPRQFPRLIHGLSHRASPLTLADKKTPHDGP